MGAEEASGHFKLTELFKASRSSSATTANLSLTGELRVSGGEGFSNSISRSCNDSIHTKTASLRLMSSRLNSDLDVLAPWPPMSMLEWLRLAPLPFKQLKEKAYDLQLLFW